MISVSVHAVIRDSPRIIADARLVLIHARRQLGQSDQPQRGGAEQKDGDEDQLEAAALDQAGEALRKRSASFDQRREQDKNAYQAHRNIIDSNFPHRNTRKSR